MWRYVARRLLWLVAVLLIITAITYVIFFVMSPVDPAVLFAGQAADAAGHRGDQAASSD